jgi:hypothetical protein
MVLDSMAFIRSSVYRVPALNRGGRSDTPPPNNTGMTLTSTAKLALVRAAGFTAKRKNN